MTEPPLYFFDRALGSSDITLQTASSDQLLEEIRQRMKG